MFKTVHVAFAVCCLATVVAGSPVAAKGGAIRVIYDNASDPDLNEIAAALREERAFDEVAAEVAQEIALPRDLPVRFTECGQPNAFYMPDKVEIDFCYEMIALLFNVFEDPEASEEEVEDAVYGASVFFLFHEMGHAFVHLFELPITGREEDSVDGLATLLLIYGDAEEAVFAAVGNFDALSAMFESGDTELAFWDEHSLSAQRAYDIACLIFGSDPEAYAGMVAPELLPPERAQRCPAEFEQKSRAWDQLLEPYLIGE